MKEKHKIALLPLDNRPVSYLLPIQIANFSGVDLQIPDRNELGGLDASADIKYITEWLNSLIESSNLIVALDAWIYGGLVQSRKHTIELNDLKTRVEKLVSIKRKMYAFSTIMRIPSYNGSDEEKEEWKDYGEKIFEWSQLMHRVGRGETVEGETNDELIDKWYVATKELPKEIIADFKSLRDKNIAVNLEWIKLQEDSFFNELVFSADDSSKYGLNVVEKEYIEKEIKNKNVSARTISGTDEIALTLITKSLLDKLSIKPKVFVFYDSISSGNIPSKYESGTIKDSIMSQLNLLDVEVVSDLNEADLVILVHSGDETQGDHIFKGDNIDLKSNAAKLLEEAKNISKPYMVLDVAYANGADPDLIDKLIEQGIDINLLYGYAGWNTTSNSAGSLLSIGINRWIAEKESTFDLRSFKKTILTRFLDDYAYQAKVRFNGITEEELNNKMKDYVSTFSGLLNLENIDVKCNLPWNRSFEVEIKINDV